MNNLLTSSKYDSFHEKVSSQNKTIDDKNFTYRIVLKILNKCTPSRNLEIIDYGCGVGTLSLYLGKKGHKVIGIDISPKAIYFARESAKKMKLERRVHFYTIDEWKLKKRVRQVDMVISIEVIEHVADDYKLLKNIYSYLKPRGSLLISTPSLNSPLHRLGLAKSFDRRVGHLRRYSVTNLSKKISESGFGIVSVYKTEGVLRNSLFLLPYLGLLIRFIKGYVSDLVTFFDDITLKLFGESDIFIQAEKL